MSESVSGSRMAVHPHTRGDTEARSSQGMISSGSPPHAWGHCPSFLKRARCVRFTPTRVGTLVNTICFAMVAPVHPHTRGDTAHDRCPPTEQPRFTPTRVGTLFIADHARHRRAVHPHTRGDTEGHRVIVPGAGGSPPHAWGHSPPRQWRRRRGRFTPTRVGTLTAPGSRRRLLSVHPHTRGDTVCAVSAVHPSSGSPPHAWGHCRGCHTPECHQRFTPTRVGTLCSSASGRIFTPVHPHTRGDTAAGRSVSLGETGSPPHAWGHYHSAIPHHPRPRFTPTRVGTLALPCSSREAAPVHPHTRGDTPRRLDGPHAHSGSPPHAWGHCPTRRSSISSSWFTPTRVGTLATPALTTAR